MKKLLLIFIFAIILSSCQPKGYTLPKRYLNEELVNLQNDDNDILESMYLSEFSLKYSQEYTFGFTLITKKELSFPEIFNCFFKDNTNYDLSNYKVAINNEVIEYQFIRDHKLIKGKNLVTFTRNFDNNEIASFSFEENGNIFGGARFSFELTKPNKK